MYRPSRLSVRSSYTLSPEMQPPRLQSMKWKNYLACFLSGVFLIHVLPHVLNGFSWMNLVLASISLGLGSLLLWIGKFSFRNLWTVALLLAGMASVLIFTALHSQSR